MTQALISVGTGGLGGGVLAAAGGKNFWEGAAAGAAGAAMSSVVNSAASKLFATPRAIAEADFEAELQRASSQHTAAAQGGSDVMPGLGTDLNGQSLAMKGRAVTHHLEIDVSRNDGTLNVFEAAASGRRGRQIFEADIVCGCDGSPTPLGRYRGGAWIADKTNPVHGPVPWSQDKWGNPYGPYFLELRNAKTGAYTSYGIHGTRGPMVGGFEKPPVPGWMLRPFLGQQETQFLYCSHGCIRMSNQNITSLHGLLTGDAYRGVPVYVNVGR